MNQPHSREREALDAILRAGLWFVDIPRTSSTSVRTQLSAKFGRTFGKRNTMDPDHSNDQLILDHLPARLIRDFVGPAAWNDLFTFSIVRNPWDRIFSLFHYRRRAREISPHLEFREYMLSLDRLLSGSESERQLFPFWGHHFSASSFVCGHSGEILVDEIIRFENRSEGLARVGDRLGLATLGTLHIQGARPPDASYRQAYDSDTRRIIERHYQSDIELFEYTFD